MEGGHVNLFGELIINRQETQRRELRPAPAGRPTRWSDEIRLLVYTHSFLLVKIWSLTKNFATTEKVLKNVSYPRSLHIYISDQQNILQIILFHITGKAGQE